MIDAQSFITTSTALTLVGAALVWFLKHHFNKVTQNQDHMEKNQGEMLMAIKMLERDIKDFHKIKEELFEQLKSLQSIATEQQFLQKEVKAMWVRIDELKEGQKVMASRDHDLRNYINEMALKVEMREMRGFSQRLKKDED